MRFFFNRLAERLWVKPLIMCLLSIGAALLARLADGLPAEWRLVEIAPGSLETLLEVMAASMLVIATFAVASMVAAYSSASSTATPRSFPLVVADDVSQNALSTFVGAFIFSIVALITFENGYFQQAGIFVLFLLTVAVFALVIMTFVRWVDRIARLGRIGSTIQKAEAACDDAIRQRRLAPNMGGLSAGRRTSPDSAVFAKSIGYVQRVDVAALQSIAEASRVRIVVAALPGTFAAPDRALAYWVSDSESDVEASLDPAAISEAFLIGNSRTFDEDPRFGLIVLAEIACRALSPAVNDPGTAIDVIGSFVRLFVTWSRPLNDEERAAQNAPFDRVEVPELSADDLFEDAFRAIARDGAGTIEVAVRMQKALESIAFAGGADVSRAAARHARLALARAEAALDSSEDIAQLREVAEFARAAR
ncbi:MAG: DUF2254 domain-containing protein [Pseudomonadales bacterium]